MENLIEFARALDCPAENTDEAMDAIRLSFTDMQSEIQKYKDFISQKGAELPKPEDEASTDEKLRDITYSMVLKDPMKFNKLLTEEEIMIIRERDYPFNMEE